jgi:hypothetical protein
MTPEKPPSRSEGGGPLSSSYFSIDSSVSTDGAK